MICLPSFVTEKFKLALKDGTISPDKLSSMSSEERRTFLEGIVGKDSAKAVNTLLESKLMLKDQQAGMIRWAKEVGNMKPEVQKDIISRITKLDTLLNPKEEKEFLSDLAEKKLGTKVTSEQAVKVSELAQTASDLKDKNPKMSGVSDEFLKAQNDLKNYVDSLRTTSVADSMGKNLATIGRNALLLNPSTPIKTSIGQIINATMDFVTRRLSTLSAKTANPDLISQANSEAWDTFKKTGANTASMENIDDIHPLNKGENFKTSGEQTVGGKATRIADQVIRKTAQITNKVAIDWEHNIAFTKFYQKTFFDMVGLTSDRIAETEGLTGDKAKARAAEILKDAARIKPETAEGATVRLEAQKQAARITNTNETFTSRLAVNAKNMLNKVIPGFRLGDFIEPMAKIPANVIANGIDNAGVGLPKGIYNIYEGRVKMQSEDLQTRYEGMAQFDNGMQRLIRIGGTLGTAALIASQIPASNFRSDNYGGHFIKIGNLWINMEYIAAISPALAGMLQAKADGGSLINKANSYTKGALSGLLNTPGLNEANSLVQALATGTGKKYITDFFSSRGEPAFISNLLKDRPIERLFFGASGVESDAQYKAEQSAKAKAAAAKAKATRQKNKTK